MTAATWAKAANDFWGEAPVLLAADSLLSEQRARRTLEASGLRITGPVDLLAAPQRLAEQARASAVWVELSVDGGAPMDRLLERLDQDVRDGRYPAVVSAPVELIDAVLAIASGADIQLVVDGSEAERLTALAIARSGAGRASSVHDAAADSQSNRLRQLSDEVSRIAATLARLSTGPGAVGLAPIALAPPGDAPPSVQPEQLRAIIRARRLRANYFSADLFADPAWDMLLDLLQAEIAQHRVPVSSLCIAAAVPSTTALRWIKTMTDSGLLHRRNDPHDGRRVFIELAPATSQSMRRYFAEVGKMLPI
ncbi:MarR family transcriptional regulator [Sphingomonas ginkgonis]|uniref:MarR family transcriptional regulator n=1 Tax=Sphingomonas ginkgonis TaxID=2315330 RepID=A0A429VD23_9SPHN|nr:winged helix DNA-binding protein [Sphingomonas ginkgonis]RST31910.1 MarR family transcriptional regulator [Sphingomonas ginkgonis]